MCALKAGTIYGELRLEDGQWVASLKESSQKTQNLTGSVFKASLAVDAFKKVLSASLNITKKAIKSAIDFNETQNKFQVIYKKGTKTYKDAVKAQKNLTKNYGLSRQAATEMLSATGDLLTGLGYLPDAALDISERVQELAVDLSSFQNIEGGAERASEALTKAILGETEMAKSLGIVIQQNTKEFNAQVNALMKTENLTRLQARAEVILSQAYDQSKNALGDYANTADQTANMQRTLLSVQEDIITQIGSAFMPAVHDITKGMLDAAKGIRDFLDDEKNIVIISQTLDGIWEGLKSVGEGLAEVFKSIAGDAKDAKNELDIFAGIMKTLSTAFLLTGKVIEIILLLVADFIDGLKTAGNTIKAFWLMASGKWTEGQELLKKTNEEALKGTIDRWKNFGTDLSNDIKDIWKKSNKATEEGLNAMIETTGAKADELNKTLTDAEIKAMEKRKETLQEWAATHEKTYDDMINDINRKRDEFISAGVSEVDAYNWAAEEISKIDDEKNKKLLQGMREVVQAAEKGFKTDLGNAVADGIGRMGEAITRGLDKVLAAVEKMSENMAAGILGTIEAVGETVAVIYEEIAGMQRDKMEQELSEMQSQHEAELEEIDADKEAKLESLEDKYLQEQELLLTQLENGTITQAEYDAKETALKDKKEKDIEKIEKDMEKKKKDRKKKQTEEENAKKKEIFEANKKNQIAMIWINAAIGIVAAWAAAMSMGNPIAAIIMGAILTALIIAAAVAQTVVISQQTYVPEKAMGGMAGGPTRVNEQGGEIITLPDGSQVIPNDISQQIASNTGGTGQNISIYVNFKGAQIANDMDLRHITDYVSNEIARRLELTT